MFFVVAIILALIVVKIITEQQYKTLESKAFEEVGISSWEVIPYFDDHIIVKSRQALEKYDKIKFFKENKAKLTEAETILERKNAMAMKLRKLLGSDEYSSQPQYSRLKKQIEIALKGAGAYRIRVSYITSAGNKLGEREISVNQYDRSKISRNYWLFEPKCRNNAEITYTQRLQIASYFP